MSVLIATYNIHRCVGRDGREDHERIMAVLQGMNADVVALQEVQDRRGEGQTLLRWLGDTLGYQGVPGVTLMRRGSHYGNALLTRVPLRYLERLDLSVPRREPRGAIAATLALGNAQLHVLATHLGLDPGERRRQVRQLLQHLLRLNPPRAMLLGDLNEWLRWSRPLRWLHGFFTPAPAPRTFPAGLPVLALDRILIRPARSLVTVEAYDRPPARTASDHLPLLARVRVE